MTKLPWENEDRAAQLALISRASLSLAMLEQSFIYNGSGRYFVLRKNDLNMTQLVDDRVYKYGIVKRLDDYLGFGIVEVEDTKTRHSFKFNSIRGYRGQPLKELNIKEGSRVYFELENDLIKDLGAE